MFVSLRPVFGGEEKLKKGAGLFYSPSEKA